MLDDLIPLDPLAFFDLEVDVASEPTRLPDLLNIKVAKVSMWWKPGGLHFLFQGTLDSIDLFIDTRALKSATLTRFCHHFFVQEGEAREITRFRTDERHPLAPGGLLKVKETKEGTEIFIPKEALYGYDPSQFVKLGFNYRVWGEDLQLLSASSEDFKIEQHPNLWATVVLV